MSFYNDECDLVDDDQYDLFTSTSWLQRHSERLDGKVADSAQGVRVERHGLPGRKKQS